ncbi:MAG TPA: FAD-binding oxidoreductase [Chloroflexota bacterium]|nr:FAD-binding oxidoreductase [Chloroflexota bacterium]
MSTELVTDLATIVGDTHVLVDPAAQQRFLRDFSWYSPVLSEAFLDNAPIDAVVQPGSHAELQAVVAAAVRRKVPITVRGAGTGNYGQSVPLYGGILLDMRRLNRIELVSDEAIEVDAGAIWEQVDAAARRHGRELRIMPTTYHIATVAGFLAGGSGGIGSVTYGRTWDGNFLSADVLTAEDPPQTMHLEGDLLRMVLHTYGTVGIVTRLRLPLLPAHTWQGWYATFPSYDACFDFGWDLAADESVLKRLVSVHEAPIPSMFEPVKRLFSPTDCAALLLLEESSVAAVSERAAAAGGTLRAWPPKPAITEFPFAHTVLWTKKFDPKSTWLQTRFAMDRTGALEQVHQLQARFGKRVVNHIEFVRTPEGLSPSGLPSLFTSDPGEIDEVISFCGDIGVGVANPHSYVVKEGGMVKDIASVVAFKQRTDPFGLLNPGKLDGTFYAGAPTHSA